MLGKIVVVLIIILIVAFVITHFNLFYHPQTPVTRSEESTLVKDIITYQFTISTNSSTKYTVPIKLPSYGNVTVKISGSKFNLSILDNSYLVYSGSINGYFERSFMGNGTLYLVFSSESGVYANVTLTEVYY